MMATDEPSDDETKKLMHRNDRETDVSTKLQIVRSNSQAKWKGVC